MSKFGEGFSETHHVSFDDVERFFPHLVSEVNVARTASSYDMLQVLSSASAQ